MAAREPTVLEALRDVGRYIDLSLQPAHNEIPQVLAALLYGDKIGQHIMELRKEGLTDAQIAHEVSHVIAPPDPDAGATIVQGVPPEQHQALLDEVAQLREAVRELRDGAGAAPQLAGPTSSPAAANPPALPGQTTSNAPGIAAPGQLTAEQQELQALREQVQSLRVQRAAGQHPTADAEPVIEGTSTPVDERAAQAE